MKLQLKIVLLFALFFAGAGYTQQKSVENPVWSKIYTQKETKAPENNNYRYIAPAQVPQKFRQNGIEAIISPNYRPMPTTNSTQSEMSIDLHPTNPEIIFGSANATNNPVTTVYGTGVYYSTNGGVNWAGADNPPFGSNSGDPAAVIGPEGNMYVGFIDGGSNLYGQGVAVSTNNGTSWSRYVVSPKPASSSDMLDKNHMYVDKKSTSPYKGRIYAAWTDFISSSANDYKLGFRYSTNGGQTWSTQKNISAALTGSYLAQGVNINTGPNGEVYAVWAVYEDGTVSTGEDAIGFNMSTDGGETWGTPKKIYTKTNFGIRGNLTSKAGIRVSSFPSMAVNRNSGEIYVVFPQKGNIAPSGNSIDICMIKSTDNGATFSAPVRVNNDDLNNSKDQYYPWATVDQSTGGLYIVFYDSRNVSNDSAQVYVAASINGGVSFENVKVSDANFKPKTISGLASGYQGDYIGIAAVNNVVYPYWADDRTGLYQGWTAKVVFATYPLNNFNLITPAANTTIASFPNSNVKYDFTWDTSASTAAYKWVFNTPTQPRKLVVSAGTNKVTFSAGQLDDMLAALGVAQGDSIVGDWNVWAYRNNLPQNDSLVSANGPRALTLKRGVPQLLPFTLSAPVNNSRFVTSANNSSQIQIKWSRSGEGIKYRWQFKTPDFNGQTKFNIQADNNGYDTNLTITNAFLDGMLSSLGLNTGDSLVGQWRVYAYRNPSDSLASDATFNITLKRQDLGEFLVVYDSTSSNCRISRDSVLTALNALGTTYDIYNRGSATSPVNFSLRSYKKVIWLGEGTSTMSSSQKDSVKSFLSNGGTTTAAKSKLIIMSEDIGYNFDRSGATYLDTTFSRQWLGFQYAMDRPTSGGAQGIINLTTGATDSISGSGWPDVLRKSTSNPSGKSLYRFRGIISQDSVNGVGKIGNNYNVAVYGIDVEALRRASDSPGGSSILRVLSNAIDYVNELLAPPAPVVTVTAPNGGENWTAGTQKSITWSSTSVTSVKLAYSTNNGTSWIDIAASVPSSGSYNWTVPATPSTQCKVKVTSTAADTVFDVSNAVFTISSVIAWESSITVKETGAGQQIMVLGMAPTATNGIDVALGEVTLPPTPPAGVFDARFELPVTPAEYSVKDYRRDTLQSASWVVKFQPGTGAYPFTISWDPALLPAGSFILKDAITGTLVNVNMKAQNSAAITNTGITQLIIEYSKQTTLSWTMPAGWNMVSVPVVASDMSATVLYPTANSAVYGYNNGYQTITNLSNGKGYWVRFPASAPYSVSGSQFASNTISLAAGWNMIGAYHTNVPVSALTTTPAGIISSVFYGFSAGYSQATALTAGQGYWVRATQAGVINLPVAAVEAKEGVQANAEIAKDWNKLAVSDASGYSSVLYLPNAEQAKSANISLFDLPPVPFDGISDIRFVNQTMAAVLGSELQTIQLQSLTYPVRFTVQGADIVLRDKATSGKLINKTLRAGESISLTQSSVQAIEVGLLDKPNSFVLEQNYPNPFNPSTTIKFGVPEKSHVQIVIFNHLGEKVTELLNDDRDAGYYTLEWNAVNFASGVYYYKITAGKFSSVKKLLLMK